MNRRLTAVLLTGLFTSAGLAVPAPASAAPLLKATDDRADVRIFHRTDGLSKRARKSIDIRTLRVREHGKKIRFTVGIKKIIRKTEVRPDVLRLLDPAAWR